MIDTFAQGKIAIYRLEIIGEKGSKIKIAYYIPENIVAIEGYAQKTNNYA